jgi:alpha-tubulin suppressor-like RCC1 family protein
LTNTGRLLAWGLNSEGQTGIGTTNTPVDTPQDVTERGTLVGRTITSITTTNSELSVALTSDGVVSCWGSNTNGDCGQGNTVSPQLVPVVVGGLLAGQTVTAIAGGHAHVLCIAGGVVYAWGNNSYAECGQGNTTTPVSLPVAVTGGSLAGKTVVKIAGGFLTSMALASDGTIHMWGYRGASQIPGGASGNQTTPINVSGFGALVGKTVVDIQAGSTHCLVICSDNTIVSWGQNYSGEVGIGNTTRQNTPQNITNNGSLAGKTVTQIFLGIRSSSSFAIASDGSIHAWGSGWYGTIGDGGLTDRTLPVNISSYGALAGQPISRLGGAGDTLFAMRDDERTVSAWGRGYHYILGTGGTTDQPLPVDVSTTLMGAL